MPTPLHDLPMTHHAERRCRQRGIRAALLGAIIDNADVERPARRGASLLSVSREVAAALNIGDGLANCGIIIGNDGAVVTVAHFGTSRRGKVWRRGRN